MIRRLVHHANRHSIAYLALVCSMLALTGASYAAFSVPRNSVGTPQLKNGSVTERKLKNQSIDPVKWNPTYVTSFVRRWANVGSTGQYVSGSPSGASKAVGTTGSGTYELTWGDAFASFCAPLATVESTSTSAGPNTTTAGFADANIQTQSGNATVVYVHTYDVHGNPAPEPFSVAILCPRGAGGAQTFPYTLP